MKPIQVTAQSGVNGGSSTAVAIDYMVSPASIGVQCVASGNPVYAVSYTLDNVLDPSVTPTWFTSDTLVGTAETPNVLGGISFPIRALRVVIGSGTGTVTMTVVQFGVR